MDYIKFVKDNNGNVRAFFNDGHLISRFYAKDAKKIYRLLIKNGLLPRIEYNDDKMIYMFYNVNEIIDNFRKNKELKKVNRKNLFIKRTIASVSSALALTLIINSFAHKNSGAEESADSSEELLAIEDVVSSTNNSELTENVNSSDELLTMEDSLTFKSSYIAPSISDDIIFEEEVEKDVIYEDDTIYEDDDFVADYTFDVEYKDRSKTDKTLKTRELYFDLIDKYSKMYGLPTDLMIAVATQEQGIHETKISKGGAFGLFQIKAKGNWNWIGKELVAYNFETGQREKVIVCLDKDGSYNMNMLADLEYNIKIGCMIMAYDLKMANYDILLAAQMYNVGTKPLQLKKKYGDEWVNYREEELNDNIYLDLILSYIDPDDNILTYKDPDNNEYTVEVNNSYKKVLTLSK